VSAPRVLVIEDDPEVLEIMRLVLEEEGYHVLTAARTVQPDNIAQLRPAVIVLDLWLGSEMAGWALLQALKATPGARQIPIVICSADHGMLIREAARLSQLAVVVFGKPFDLDAFLGQMVALCTATPTKPRDEDDGEGKRSPAPSSDAVADGEVRSVQLWADGHVVPAMVPPETAQTAGVWRLLGWVWERGQRLGFVRAEMDQASWTGFIPLDALGGSDAAPRVRLRRQPAARPGTLCGWLRFC
jgi:CheY-like chemotaxis protein